MFEGKLVRLRAITREDLPRYTAWINDQEVARYITVYRPVSLEDEERWFMNAGVGAATSSSRSRRWMASTSALPACTTSTG